MPVYSVILFGSYAKNSATANSDLDLVIDTKEQLMGFKLYSLITKIEEFKRKIRRYKTLSKQAMKEYAIKKANSSSFD